MVDYFQSICFGDTRATQDSFDVQPIIWKGVLTEHSGKIIVKGLPGALVELSMIQQKTKTVYCDDHQRVWKCRIGDY